MRFIEKEAAKKCSMIVVCSTALKDQVITQYNIPSSKIHVLYQGVDLSKFTFHSRHNSLKNKININIAFIKSDYQRGGLFILKSAIALLSHITFTLTVAGPWPEEIIPITKEFNQIKNCQLVFLGPIEESQVVDLLHNNDIFCVPSLREALGVANIEALACGIPVVTTSSMGIPEVLNYGENGWMCKPGDSQDLAHHLQLCINSDVTRIKKTLLGRKYVETNFDVYRNLEAFISTLELNADL
jgi:glycosyltransferase involved in cell wall biosynthesis